MSIESSLESPWRHVFEEVRLHIGNKRDVDGVLGSINWLRKQMNKRGANPNVVRNIIYRDKGKLLDKKALFEILKELWAEHCQKPLQAPELEVLLSAGSSAEQEITQLLGREKRRAYTNFVNALRNKQQPKLLITGRPGSGKTLLLDYIQQVLDLSTNISDTLVRIEFSGTDLATSLTHLALALGVSRDVIEAKLIAVGTASAFAVQADAQADIARTILERVRRAGPLVLMVHLSQGLSEQDTLGASALRLNTSDVPRVSAAEWLWMSLLEPMSKLSTISLLVSMVNIPMRAMKNLGRFEGPIKLNPPTAAEARRFVKARLPQLPSQQQEDIVQRAGRSFEELRTLALLAEIREPFFEADQDSKHVERLSQLIDTAGDLRLREFLAALAVVSVPEFSSFHDSALIALRSAEWRHLSSIEQAFLDAVPGELGHYRCFSRQLSRMLRQHLKATRLAEFRSLNERLARHYEPQALVKPTGDHAARYLHHLFEARSWDELQVWLSQWGAPQSLQSRLWEAAKAELSDRRQFETIALHVASHFVRLGSYGHPDALDAFEQLAKSERANVRLWTTIKRAEGAVLMGHVDRAEMLLASWSETDDAILNAEYELIRARIDRWRSRLAEAAARVNQKARPYLEVISDQDAAGRLVHAKVAVWSGLIAKDSGSLEEALNELRSVQSDDDLIAARLAFQMGDVELKLGYFDAALHSLNQAVERSHSSEALLQEQTRYLARRGRLHRLRGELEAAGQDFEAALRILKGELLPETQVRGFWLAKTEDERALYLLANAQYDQAIFLLQHNRKVFEQYQKKHHVDAGYRIIRNGLRLALAYSFRGMAQAYQLPYLHTVTAVQTKPDIVHAKKLIKHVIASLESKAKQSSSFASLQRHSLFVASLINEPQGAVDLAKQALDLSRFDYHKAKSMAYISAAYIRLGDDNAASVSLKQAYLNFEKAYQKSKDHGDLGLFSWLKALELTILLRCQDIKAAVDSLLKFLDDARVEAYKLTLLRVFGEGLERVPSGRKHPALKRLLAHDSAFADTDIRLADTLVIEWQNKLAKVKA